MAARTAPRRTASHRPAVRRRRYRHDDLVAVDLFSGFGGLTQGIERAGFTTIMAANHNAYKVKVHEANHPNAEHWIADLVNPESADYHSARDLPAADLLVAGVSCVNHSPANTKKAYQLGLNLFELDDPDYEDRVTRSERDRATANCVLHYAAKHHPRMILVECTTELQSWGRLVPGKRKVGDGSTYRWWLKQFDGLGYRHKVLFLNSMFFGVGQSRDRGYWVFWDKTLATPDLEHRPDSWCASCDEILPAVWTWKTGVPPTGTVRYGKQYHYTCARCHREVTPPYTPSLAALDLSNLGTRIGGMKLRSYKDKTTGESYQSPLARATLARAERCRQRFAEFPAVLMPAKANHGTERHPWQPMATQTSQQEVGVLSTGAVIAAAGNTFERPGSTCRTRTLAEPLPAQTATNGNGLLTAPVALAVDNYQGAPRSAADALPVQGGSETMAVVSSGVLPFRKNTVPTSHAEAMPTVTADQTPALLSAAWLKQNGSTGTETAAHPVTDPFGTLTSRDTTALVTAQWTQMLADLTLEDCYFRMMYDHEIGRGCGFDVTFPDHEGTFIVWGSARDRVDGFGNAVSPPVGHWIGGRLYDVLHGQDVAA
ncbi:DNA cytosine methyltransferase [Flexivirga sp.]|uniref:DNA cytosine methyltransferase n=1 Tax=Flexivirga sp. TaxID=1962927 RepID=UPI003F8136F5